VLGTDPVPSADVPALLARLAPTWAPYQAMTGKVLRDQLAECGVQGAEHREPVAPRPGHRP